MQFEEIKVDIGKMLREVDMVEKSFLQMLKDAYRAGYKQGQQDKLCKCKGDK